MSHSLFHVAENLNLLFWLLFREHLNPDQHLAIPWLLVPDVVLCWLNLSQRELCLGIHRPSLFLLSNPFISYFSFLLKTSIRGHQSIICFRCGIDDCAPFTVTQCSAARQAILIASMIPSPLLRPATRYPKNVSPAAVVSTATTSLATSTTSGSAKAA